jgi:hypothetical protein
MEQRYRDVSDLMTEDLEHHVTTGIPEERREPHQAQARKGASQ